MKFTFEADLDYQRAAIDAVAGVFAGQDVMSGTFDVYAHPGMHAGLITAADSGVANRLVLDADTVLENLRAVQLRQGFAPEDSLTSMNFTVEMETGTGKTYVYLRTVFELNKLYGFSKFIVVVPSVAIKEGVLSSLRMLELHFAALYSAPMQYFAYDGANPSRVRSFATSPAIEIMVVTIGSVNKASNTIHKPSESLDDERPIDLISATSPVVIIDEPQSVYGDDGNPKRKPGAGRVALEKFKPLAVLRYSATHPKYDRNNLIYRLDAIAAYEKQLVKQIEIDSLVTESGGTRPYLQLKAVKRAAGAFSARIEVDVEQGGRTVRKTVTARNGDNLRDVTGRELYADLTLTEISVTPERIRLDTVAEPLHPGESIGDDVGVEERTREMIAQTIRQHLRKEQEFAVSGLQIKVLSLFFIDAVAKYRGYDANGLEQPGEYARIFEEEYTRIAREPEFTTLLAEHPADAVARGAHQGYFSVDRDRKSGVERLVDTAENTSAGRQQAELAYVQIMKDKAGLTTPGTPLRFIFSHSALQEGWDNPNVFQICVLRNMGSERWRRQSVGRGLRLCVDGHGNRVRGFTVNRLTVIANESFEEFADNLQRELAEDLGIEFGKVTVDGFARLTYNDPDVGGAAIPIGAGAARSLFTALLAGGYIDAGGAVSETLRKSVQESSAALRALVAAVVPQENGQLALLSLIKRLARPIDIKRASERVTVPLIRQQLESSEFQALWSRIRHRTEYRLQVEETELRAELVKTLREMPPVPLRKGEWRTARVERIDQGGISADLEKVRRTTVAYIDSEDLPDILSVLADRTQLTRATIAAVLTESGTLQQFRTNPQAYTSRVAQLLNETKALFLAKGLQYDLVAEERPDDERWYPLTLLEQADLQGYMGPGGNIVSNAAGDPVDFSEKSPYAHVVVDSKNIEKEFALALLQREDVKAFVKLPARFTVPTPFGAYNPDWAVMVQLTGGSRYIVFETKGTTNTALLGGFQEPKTVAGRLHFATVAERIGLTDLGFAVVTDINDADGVLDASVVNE
ncbi:MULTISPECIES: DEAD/DEAH box helicase family protein [unclassified Rathayibacter]|uniref:restriction endonuclease n=1 Tax=unclassified Rathayibacter TaxID=2609250 RepID=UPI000CE7824F|nr:MULTISPECIES: DEAD/DEAH box helicase family protein [unclassified Rathayibacter]PPF11595.1 type III restriction endonuclease [Rathayibacter sp. AY1A5]PPH90564.1 type III restriction endonuclease [Rathayibacter sp. AY1D3]